MSIKNNIVKISKSNNTLTSLYVENELLKMGYTNVLRWAIVEVLLDTYTINFAVIS